MTRLHIPNLGEELVLASDWTFTLINEHRNYSLFGEPVFEVGTKPFSRKVTSYEGPIIDLQPPDTKWTRNASYKLVREYPRPVTCHPYPGMNPTYYEYEYSGENVEYKLYPDKEFTLPAGTVLIYDRVYIRKGAEKFDSVTFRIAWCPVKEYMKKRFFARLYDVNKIEFVEKE